MAYHPIRVPPETSPELAEIVSRLVDPLLADVHAMLRLPQKDIPGLGAGCNLSAVLNLLAVVSGVSTQLAVPPHPSEGIDPEQQPGALFIRVLENHFPWSEEPQNGTELLGRPAAEILYDVFRNPLTHSLGIYKSDKHGDPKAAKGALAEEDKAAAILRTIASGRGDLHDSFYLDASRDV